LIGGEIPNYEKEEVDGPEMRCAGVSACAQLQSWLGPDVGCVVLSAKTEGGWKVPAASALGGGGFLFLLGRAQVLGLLLSG
jgi:uncharacterized membrane protein